MGSGNAVKAAIKKYGYEAFTRETLCIGAQDYIYKLEEKYVDEAFRCRKDTYNISVGGKGRYKIKVVNKPLVSIMKNKAVGINTAANMIRKEVCID